MNKNLFAKAKADPKNALHVALALFRGHLIKYRYRLRKKDVQIGSSFRAYSDLRIKGSGKVVLGDKLSVDLSFLRIPTILTHSQDSVVEIGSGCYLGGIRISCLGSVSIGNEVLMGSTTIIDSDMIPNENMAVDEKWKEEHCKPVKVGSYVWAGINSFIMGGTTLADECVLGAGSVILNKEAAERSLMVGNPARKVGVTR